MGRRSARSVIIMRHQIISGARKRVLLRLLKRTEEDVGGRVLYFYEVEMLFGGNPLVVSLGLPDWTI